MAALEHKSATNVVGRLTAYAFSLAIFVALDLHAAKAGELTKEYTDCINRTSSNSDWDDCGVAEINRQEARLNSAWQKALLLFDGTDQTSRDAKASLIEEERLWIKWKDAACKFYYPSKPGDASEGWAGREGEVLHAPGCKAAIISERATFLEDLVIDRQ